MSDHTDRDDGHINYNSYKFVSEGRVIEVPPQQPDVVTIATPSMKVSTDEDGRITVQPIYEEKIEMSVDEHDAHVAARALIESALLGRTAPDGAAQAVRALAYHDLLVTPERDAAVAARAWDEGFKQGGPMHDVNYDDPDAHTRNPYRIEREGDVADADA